MKQKFLTILAILVGLVVSRPGGVGAAMQYGSGYYTNLCGTGTDATAYTCGGSCNPGAGLCSGVNNGVVRYVCVGNWNQCLENEGEWGNGATLGTPNCGNTVQLSVYDHKCRQADGSWDGSCRLLGYMVWYSGECRPGVSGYPTGMPIPSNTSRPINTTSPAPSSKFSTPTPIVSVKPTVTVKPTITVAPTLSKPKAICNRVCSSDNDCDSGLVCSNKTCRNQDCPSDKSCFCGGGSGGAATASGTGVSPETGANIWLLGAGIAVLGFLGFKALRVGKMLWS